MRFFVSYYLPEQGSWPVWIPLENILSPETHAGHFSKIIEETAIKIKYSKKNTNYVDTHVQRRGLFLFISLVSFLFSFISFLSFHSFLKSKKLEKYQGDKQLESNLCWSFSFPSSNVIGEVAEYNIIYDVIDNLILYREPNEQAFTDRLETMNYKSFFFFFFFFFCLFFYFFFFFVFLFFCFLFFLFFEIMNKVKEGWFLQKHGMSPYEGDSFHLVIEEDPKCEKYILYQYKISNIKLKHMMI